MSEHTITAVKTVHFRLPDMPEDERESAQVEMEIRYDFTPGAPPTGPSYASGGEPGYPAEVSLIEVNLIDGGGLAPEPFQLREWATDWLDQEGYDEACENAVPPPREWEGEDTAFRFAEISDDE